MLFNEANTKWNSIAIDKMTKKMKQIDRGMILLPTDSNQWSVVKNTCLPGGLLSIFFSRTLSLVKEKETKRGKLGNWIVMPMEKESKRIAIVNVCRMPISSK